MKNHFADNNIAGAFRADPRGRAGFSLLTVLIIVMAGLTIIGVTFQLTTASSGAGRVSSAHRAKYNLLESGVEMGKAAIKEMMNNDQDPPRHFPAGGTEPATEITKAGDLLLDGGLGVVAS